jgi:hypothetical protein
VSGEVGVGLLQAAKRQRRGEMAGDLAAMLKTMPVARKRLLAVRPPRPDDCGQAALLACHTCLVL